MEDNVDSNKMLERSEDFELFEFNYNFFNTPWDDRSKKNKFGAIALLIAIFVVIMACVINNFIMHYREYGITKNTTNNEVNCNRVKIEEYPFVARIHSMSSKELLCIGAVVSTTSILANGACVKSGPIRVHLGNPIQPQCRKGFTVDVIEKVYHDGIVSRKLALLSSNDDITRCSSPVKIGKKLRICWDSKAYIIGRPLNMGRSLSRQFVSLIEKEEALKDFGNKQLRMDSMICVKDLAKCPVRLGDLLVQDDYLYGISETNMHHTDEDNFACFAELSNVQNELKELAAKMYK